MISIIVLSVSVSIWADEPDKSGPAQNTSQAQTTTERNKRKEKAEAEKSLSEQKASLQKRMKDNEEKLKKYKGSAEETEDYIDALDEKIGYMNEELNLLDKDVADSQKNIETLEEQIKPVEKELKSLEKQYEKAQSEYTKLNEKFDKTYNAYCLRLRALYISGNSSIIEALLMSDDISQFISRFEMVKAVSKSDTELLKEVNSQMDKIVSERDGLNTKKTEVQKTKTELDSKTSALKSEQKNLKDKQDKIASTKVSISQDRAESDRLFAKYSEKMHIYTEFRNEDEELVKKVDKEIDDLLSGLKDPNEVTTAKNTEQDPNKVTGDYVGDSELFSRSNAALSLTYPAPGHYGVSQSFGHYRNGRAHTGIDFPCPTGSKIVAAQKGIVVKVRRLNYSYGYYVMVYHGTDAKGRKVVTLYAHNSSIMVSVGQSVRKGQQIAKSGSTGNSTGPHCHFELILDGSKVNPKNYLGK